MGRARLVLPSLVLTLVAGCARRPDPLAGFPRIVLWAWGRPERLMFLDPRTTGVAFLALRVEWREGRVRAQPRYQPLEVPAGTAMIAVTRMDSFSPLLPDAEAIAGQIAGTASLARVRAVQVDFDARLSERGWYAGLLGRVRARLPASMPLTITALASWCRRDPWIRGLPINDAVPMLFQMGPGEPPGATEFSLGVCRSSLGIATDEMPARLPGGRRVFVFDPHPWTAEAARAAIEFVRRWQ